MEDEHGVLAPMPRSASRASRLAARTTIAVLVALVVATCGPSCSVPGPGSSESIQPMVSVATLHTAVPDANVGADVARRWVDRARRDSRAWIPSGDIIAPLLVNAEPGASMVILGDYSSGSQILVRYDDDDPASARLIEVEYPSSTLTGPSNWEVARVRAALSEASTIGSLTPARITILPTGWGRCRDGTGACPIVRLDDPEHPTPSSAPALAPQVAVRLADLAVLPAVLPVEPGPGSGG